MFKKCIVLCLTGNLKGFKMVVSLYKPHVGKVIQPLGIGGEIKVLKILDKCANNLKS